MDQATKEFRKAANNIVNLQEEVAGLRAKLESAELTVAMLRLTLAILTVGILATGYIR